VKLNRLGRAGTNNPVREAMLRRRVAPMMERLGGRVDGGRVLEVGCGRGVGVEIILERFGAGSVQALDLDPHMVGLARRRLAGYPPERVRVDIGDATAIDAPDGGFDAVFDFGAVHLVERWERAVAEVARVLRPGGTFYFEEIVGPLYRSVFPLVTDGSTAEPSGGRFTRDGFFSALEEHGLSVRRWVTPGRLLVLSGTVGDLIGAARAEPYTD
jgi:ubiquinone/menaquinone biosynthesis C-methylase UbiE